MEFWQYFHEDATRQIYTAHWPTTKTALNLNPHSYIRPTYRGVSLLNFLLVFASTSQVSLTVAGGPDPLASARPVLFFAQ